MHENHFYNFISYYFVYIQILIFQDMASVVLL